jgi:hypothetical protein
VRGASAAIAAAKGQQLSPEALAESAGSKVAFAYAFYKHCLAICGYLDMDDLVPAAVHLLSTGEDARRSALECVAVLHLELGVLPHGRTLASAPAWPIVYICHVGIASFVDGTC